MPMGARRMTQLTILKMTTDRAWMPLVRNAPDSPETFMAAPNTMETISAAMMVWPVRAPNSDSGMMLLTNSRPSKPLLAAAGTLLASSL